MKKHFIPLVLLVVSLLAAGCASHKNSLSAENFDDFQTDLSELQNRFAPDHHLAVFNVEFQTHENELVLTGEVDSERAHREVVRAAERTGAKVVDQIKLLPDAELGDTNWGITTLSVANGRENSDHKAELGTQTLMGETVRVLKRSGRWLLVQSHDQYISWMENGSLRLCTRTEADAWEHEPLLIFTNLDGVIREAPEQDAQPLSDIVLGCRVKQLGESNGWFKVELPDGRSGFLAKNSATDFSTWKQSLHATPENIERMAKQFIGRPYLWGANSPRGMDCSGFTKLTYFLNGIELRRNASQQAKEGIAIPLDENLSQLRKGDLLFFGFENRDGGRGRVSHTGIYLGDKLFIQSSGRVRISSLDPDSPIADKARIRSLIAARRMLPRP